MPGIGWFLRAFKSDERKDPWNAPELDGPETLAVTSTDFGQGEHIPPDPHRGAPIGADRSPALAWSTLPDGTQSVLLLMVDVDVPLTNPVVHTAAVLEPSVHHLPTGALVASTPGVRFLRASFGAAGYHGPRPLPGHGAHRYRFEVFALDTEVDEGPQRLRDVVPALAGHVLARGVLVGVDER